MDNIELLLKICQRTEESLNRHIEKEDHRFERIDTRLTDHDKDIGELQKAGAIAATRISIFSAAIASVITGAFAWLIGWFGVKG